MNRVLALAPLLLLTLWLHGAHAQWPADVDGCNKSSTDQRIAACTRLIDSGQLSSQDRASAFHNRGIAWADKRDYGRAIADYNEALRINPLYALAYYHRFMAQQKQPGDAGSNTGPKEAPSPAVNPKDAAGYNKRGIAWAEKRDFDRAIADYNEALLLNPQYAFAYYNRGNAWRNKRDFDRAIADYGEALRINPQYAFAYYHRGNAWIDKGDYSRAIADYNEALRLNPQSATVHNSAAWLLATAPVAGVRNGVRAVELARKAADLSASKDADILDTLAAAYAEAGNFADAVRWQEKALEFSEFAKNQGDAARKRLEGYRKGQPYHQTPKA